LSNVEREVETGSDWMRGETLQVDLRFLGPKVALEAELGSWRPNEAMEAEIRSWRPSEALEAEIKSWRPSEALEAEQGLYGSKNKMCESILLASYFYIEEIRNFS
jgi:hypothetical protein